MSLGFATPWALAALALLPALWWWLRVTPPAPRQVPFPAIRLLLGLEGRRDTAARTPPWVLLLRLALAAAVILAAADPSIESGPPPTAETAPLVVVIDNDWAAAADWSQRQSWLDGLLGRAERAGRAVTLVATAPPADGGRVRAVGPMPAFRARALIRALAPEPWPADRAAAVAAINGLDHGTATDAVWLTDGLDSPHAGRLIQALQNLHGQVRVAFGRAADILLPPKPGSDPALVAPTVLRPDGGGPAQAIVEARNGKGQVLARGRADFAADQGAAVATLRLPTALRNTLTRLDIAGETSAAGVLLLDARWRRVPVGLVEGGANPASPLLDPLYYIDKALAPVADPHRGDLADLLGRHMAVLMLADVGRIEPPMARRLSAWIAAGGVLVRFAGPDLARAALRDHGILPFLPVRLQGGDRRLGGAMSWTKPQKIAPFPPHSPFAGLSVPADVRVSAEVLAQPGPDLAGHSWARLADGTPLVTGARRGRGWVVLIHTTADTAWSNLVLSGLFPRLLHRLTMLAAEPAGAGPLSAERRPIRSLNGYGRLGPPPAASVALPIAGPVRPGPRHPPGLYGGMGGQVAFNLGPALTRDTRLSPLTLPAGVARVSLSHAARQIDLRPIFLVLAVFLALADILAGLALRGLLRPIVGMAALLLAAHAVHAAPMSADAFARKAALHTRLAYVITGDPAVDAKSRAGLIGLTRVLADRSTAVLAPPMGVDIETRPVLFFPLLYWPVTSVQPPPSPAAAARINAYLRHGGLIVFDTQDGGAPSAARSRAFRALTRRLDMPPLMPLPTDDVLNRTFYLLRSAPGRYGGGTVWVAARGSTENDGVSPVVVGSADWAGAWAVDAAGRPLFPTEPGGARQREMAFRFGINLVMYALTGNYKEDQIQLPAILRRLGR